MTATSNTLVVEASQESQARVAGHEIIDAYLKGDRNAASSYRKICAALERFGTYKEDARTELLTQVCGASHLLSEKCHDLVKRFCAISWLDIPTCLRQRYYACLSEIAVRYLSHTEAVYTTVISYFRPKQFPKADSPTEVEFRTDSVEQEELYKTAHSVLNQIYRCVPMSEKVLVHQLKRQFPHMSSPLDVYVGYLRNLILVSEYAPKLRVLIWTNIIEELITLDVRIGQPVGTAEGTLTRNSSSGIFIMDEEEEQSAFLSCSDAHRENVEKMDACMRDIFDTISTKMGRVVDGASWLKIGEECDMFSVLEEAMDTHLLMSGDVHFLPFIWLHLCSLNQDYPDRLLEWLWKRVTGPQRAQSDGKRSQAAAAYLAAFLARATYINSETAFSWLGRIFEWMLMYVNQCGIGQTNIMPGMARHGTFYALAQAFFIVFTFRYKKIVQQSDKLAELKRWGIGRVVHCSLDPLKFMSRPVALCFSTITRSLQLVYCHHYVSLMEEGNLPFESIFPLDYYHLPTTWTLIRSLMRKFSPLAEDAALLSQEFRSASARHLVTKDSNGTLVSHEMAFLDDEEMEIGSFRERSGTCGVQSSIFTSFYSTSPGLKHFDSFPGTSSMDMRQ